MNDSGDKVELMACGKTGRALGCLASAKHRRACQRCPRVMKRYGVRPSVLSIRPLQQRRRVCCCGPGWWEISTDRCTGDSAEARDRSTARSSKCGQRHVLGLRRRLNGDLTLVGVVIVLSRTDAAYCYTIM